MVSTCLENVEGFPDYIQRCLANPSGKVNQDVPANFRKAAVIMPLLLAEGEWQVLFTRRSDTVQNHKGQVSFPGGASEEMDAGPAETACRELQEEIGISSEDVKVLGQLQDMRTITSFTVTPVIGVIPWPVVVSPNPNEVARVFTIPLCWLADPDHWEERLYRLLDGSEHPVIFYDEYDGELLWGVTARIVLNFLEQVGLPKHPYS